VNVDFNSPESIAAWIAINPPKHTAMLSGLWTIWPQFRAAIETAVALSRRTPYATP